MVIKILAVDDMSSWRGFHESMLLEIFKDANQKLELTLKNSATDAFEDIQVNIRNPYDLIISDLQMETSYEPEHAGEWLVRNTKLLKTYQTRPIVIVSAAWNIKSIAENLNVDYLPKTLIVNNPLAYKLKIKEILF